MCVYYFTKKMHTQMFITFYYIWQLKYKALVRDKDLREASRRSTLIIHPSSLYIIYIHDSQVECHDFLVGALLRRTGLRRNRSGELSFDKA